MSDRSRSQDWADHTAVLDKKVLARTTRRAGNDCLVIIYARDTAHLGRRFVLDNLSTSYWVGRESANNIVVESDTCSRRHAVFEFRENEWWVIDNRSTNGTYVNDQGIDKKPLRHGDHVKIGDTIFKYLSGSDVESEFIQTIGTIMVTDGLTLAHNRRYFTEQLEKELSRAKRSGRPLSLVMLDLDHFKRINDTYGHLAGDYVLREVANLVREVTPRDVVFARYGGEEFAIIAPEMPLAEAASMAETIRARVEKHAFQFEGQQIPVTTSMGVSIVTDDMNVPDDFIKVSDTRLFAAKHAGRNRVVSSS